MTIEDYKKDVTDPMLADLTEINWQIRKARSEMIESKLRAAKCESVLDELESVRSSLEELREPARSMHQATLADSFTSVGGIQAAIDDGILNDSFSQGIQESKKSA